MYIIRLNGVQPGLCAYGIFYGKKPWLFHQTLHERIKRPSVNGIVADNEKLSLEGVLKDVL